MNVRENLKAYIDNELNEAAANEVRAEIDRDPSLQAEVVQLRRLARILRTEPVSPQVAGKEETLRRLGRASKPARPPIWIFATGAIALVGAMLIAPLSRDQPAGVAEESDLYTRASVSSASGGQAEAPTLRSESEQPKAALPDAGRMQSESVNRSPGGAEFAPIVAQIIKTAQMSVLVGNAASAKERVETLVRGVGGLIESSSTSDLASSAPSVSMSIRAPVRQFDSLLTALRKLGQVTSETQSGDDVTGQVADIAARLRVLRAEEDQYVTLLSRASRIGDVLAVKERLGQVRLEIESLDAQQRMVSSQARMSTINLTLQQKPPKRAVDPSRSWSENAWARAVARLEAVGRWVAVVGINLVVFLPILLAIGALGWLAVRRR